MSAFSPTLTDKIKARLAKAETPPCAILPILTDIQDEHDCISAEHQKALASEFNLPLKLIEEVASFYSMLRREKGAQFKITCCDSPSCAMMGASDTVRKLKEHAAKHTAGTFGVETVPCLGVCGMAPALLVNKDRHHNVTADKVEGLLDQYAKLS